MIDIVTFYYLILNLYLYLAGPELGVGRRGTCLGRKGWGVLGTYPD